MIRQIDHVATLIVGPRSLTSCLIGCAHAEVAVRFNHLMMIRLLGETLSCPCQPAIDHPSSLSPDQQRYVTVTNRLGPQGYWRPTSSGPAMAEESSTRWSIIEHPPDGNVTFHDLRACATGIRPSRHRHSRSGRNSMSCRGYCSAPFSVSSASAWYPMQAGTKMSAASCSADGPTCQGKAHAVSLAGADQWVSRRYWSAVAGCLLDQLHSGLSPSLV